MLYWTEIEPDYPDPPPRNRLLRITSRHLSTEERARKYARRWLNRRGVSGEVRIYRYDTGRHITDLIERYRYDGRRPEGPPDAA